VSGASPGHNVPPAEWQRIGDLITNPDSPVGIDAKKTHIIIIHTLQQLEKRLDALEKKLAGK